MQIEQIANSLNQDHAAHIPQLLTPQQSQAFIAQYIQATDKQAASQAIIDQCWALINTPAMQNLLTQICGKGYQVMWPIFDVIDNDTINDYLSKLWHLDGGVPGCFKLFVYLNSVQEHGCNTHMVSRQVTEQLRSGGYLPLETEKRTEDLSAAHQALGIPQNIIAFDLQAGDGFVFSNTKLAHKCQPPKPGQARYTICYQLNRQF